MFGKIVVGLDGSKPSENALRMACNLASKYGSELHLVHTPQPKTVAFAMGAVTGYHTVTTMPSPEEVQTASNKIIQKATSIANGCGITVTQSFTDLGEPADQIVKRAKDCNADLIVTGRRGLGTVGSLLQGSTTQRVNHLAECASLSVA